METEIQNLRIGNVFVLDNEEYTVAKIDVSKIGKHGRAKVRVEVRNNKTNENKTIIRVSTEKIEKK